MSAQEKHPFVTAEEHLLVRTMYGKLGDEGITHPGPLSLSEAAKLYEQTGDEFQAVRMNFDDLRDVEDVTEEIEAFISARDNPEEDETPMHIEHGLTGLELGVGRHGAFG